MTTPAFQIWPITELRSRCKGAGDSVRSVKIFQGHLYPGTNKSVLILDIRRDSNNQWPDHSFDYIERHDGEYTAVFQPTKEIMFLQSPEMNGGIFRNQFPYNTDFISPQKNDAGNNQHLMNRIVQLERENEKLKIENGYLKEDLKQFDTFSGKLEYSVIGILENYVFPKFANGVNNRNERPMQGTHTDTMEWTKIHINPSNKDESLKASFEVLLDAFGEDKIIAMAQKLQAQPHLVQTLSSFL